jgi:hypothetical protein
MRALPNQRCLNHGFREAVARCPECRQYFCRECITEHDDRVVCTTCLKKLAATPRTKRRSLANVKRAVQCVAGVLVAWFFFFLIGEILVGVPDSFHEGTLWTAPRSEP